MNMCMCHKAHLLPMPPSLKAFFGKPKTITSFLYTTAIFRRDMTGWWGLGFLIQRKSNIKGEVKMLFSFNIEKHLHTNIIEQLFFRFLKIHCCRFLDNICRLLFHSNRVVPFGLNFLFEVLIGQG